MEGLFINEAYQYYRNDIYNEYRIELLQRYNIAVPGSVSPRMWELFGAILTGKRGMLGAGVDLQDCEIKSSMEGSSFEYQYHLKTGQSKLLEDMRVNHIFISYSPSYRNVAVRMLSGLFLTPLFQSWLPGIRQRYETEESNRRYRKNVPYGTVRQHGTLIMQILESELIYPPSL